MWDVGSFVTAAILSISSPSHPEGLMLRYHTQHHHPYISQKMSC